MIPENLPMTEGHPLAWQLQGQLVPAVMERQACPKVDLLEVKVEVGALKLPVQAKRTNPTRYSTKALNP